MSTNQQQAQASERKSLNAYELCNVLERFADDNAHSRDISLRWLANWIGGSCLSWARQVRNSSLDDDTQSLVNQFRLGEIGEEIAKCERMVADLRKEADAIAQRKLAS